jgi:hypothetical protein
VTAAVVFSVVLGAYLTGHQVDDYWLQTGAQALGKGLPGWAGRRACAAHVATYTLTLAACLALAAWRLALPVSPAWAAAGLAVSAVTHYIADRRRPLQRIADALGGSLVPGKGEFWRSGEGLASGAAHLDQSWHWLWLFAAALITAGGVS